jgi:SEC-C motif domain protein
MRNCPCGSGRDFADCCAPYLAGTQTPPTAEALMRSRYSAYVERQIPYLGETLHPEARGDYDEAATRRWAEAAEWQGLEVRATEAGGEGDAEGTVEFLAQYKEKGVLRRHQEIARFRRHQGRWYYLDGSLPAPKTVQHQGPRVGRNDPCPCGSGKKYKKCCGA